jgi:biotin operon repressor
MHTYVRTLTKIASRYAPSRILSFDSTHVIKVLQLLSEEGHVSRNLLCQELSLGEGSIKTLVKHLKTEGLIDATNYGTTMTEKGRKLASEILSLIPAETAIPKCSIALGKFNYAVLVKGFSFAVKLGIEQRDGAITIGALGATTLLFKGGKFVMPGMTNHDSLKNESGIYGILIDKLKPEQDDVIIIGSDNEDRRRADLAAKNAALITIMNHDRHNHI